jgi:(1->4)-alpha-D-glucan 1-alpha-D-glucosylmutase
VTSTYRLQLHGDFPFAEAAARVPYLQSLGVTHLYLSPILQAAAGSRHGYDVVDHTSISRELGGEEGLLALAETAAASGLGLVVDVVPNHMALVAPEHANRPLWEVLRDGRDARTAHWFDIDWKSGGGRLGLPILGGTLAEAVEAGEITLGEYDGQPVVRYFDHVLPVALGTEGDDVAEVLQRQHYSLANWRAGDTMLNYRRFFEVDELIAVRVELPDVFQETHQLLLELNHRGVIDGFRIDHPDGLADPEGYLQQLRDAVRPGTLVWVEKILEGQERLPRSWACDGTTGYDAIQAVTATLVDPASEPVVTRTWVEAGGHPEVELSVQRAKRQVVDELLGPELQRLTRRAREALPEAEPDRLQAAVTELLVAGEVYRAYVHPDRRLSPLARKRLDRAFDEAVETRPDLRAELEALLGLAMTEDSTQEAAVDFAIRLQQTWGPVMAKGIEDTTFYRWHRLVALNEVGGDPSVLDGATPEILHRWAVAQQRDWPLGMTTLSTHDTKRSEDVRARLLAVAGDPVLWERCADLFWVVAESHDVDPATAHLLWQTLVGVGEISRERLHDYLVKAIREAKQRTAWIDGDEAYEARVLALADEALAPGFLQEAVTATVAANTKAIRSTVLAQKLLQLLLPGVADTYQGCELVNLSLVDPDNRRPVDYLVREQRLERLDAGRPPVDLDDEKLLVTSTALRLRREQAACFGRDATYEPLATTTEHAVGYVRSGPDSGSGSAAVAVVVTRAPRRLAAEGGWRDAAVVLPDGTWRDRLTGRTFYAGAVECMDLLDDYPVSLLVRGEDRHA